MVNAANISKPRLFLALAALFLTSMCTMGDLVITPIVVNVYAVFEASPIWLVNLGISGPALVGLPFGLLTGYLCDRFNKRTIMIVGFAIFTVSSVFGIAFENVYYFVTMRLLATGVGWGITNTAALSILADLFPSDIEHGKYVGWYNAVMSLLGALMSSVSGFLALDGWTHAYATYLISIPVFVMLVAFLPHFPPQSNTASKIESIHAKSRSSAAAIARGMAVERKNGEVQSGWWISLIPLAVQVFFVAVFYYVILYMVGVYVDDKQLGDEAFVGMLVSIMTISTAVGSVVFGIVYKRMGNNVCFPAIAVIAAAFFILGASNSRMLTIAALGLAGFAWPFFFCYFYTYCTEIVPSSKKGMATSIVAATNGLAATACSYVLTGAMNVTGAGCSVVYPIFGTVMIIVLVVSIIWKFMHRRV